MALEKKRSSRLSLPCILIIVVASVERFAYKGVASNLVTYLTDVVKMSTSSAAKSVSCWIGITSMLPLVTAVLADSSYWDRYSTIMCSSFLYVAGLVGLTTWALLSSWMPTATLFLPLYLISIGQGGYNPSLQAFGADQLQLEDDMQTSKEDENCTKKSSFFQWWYFGICSGSLLGNSIMSYIQDCLGWGLGFAIPTAAMALSVSCFLCGSRLYVYRNAAEMKRINGSFIKALKISAESLVPRKPCFLPRDNNVKELELEEQPLRQDFDNPKKLDDEESITEEPASITKTILRLLPIWLMLLMFAVIFQQPLTFFTKQGVVMKRNIGTAFEIPPAMFQSTITISIILLMPFYNKIIIPVLRSLTRDEKGINVLQRIGIGMVLSILAMIVAALVESKRLEISKKGSLISSNEQLTIFWLLPQYILLGISDVFTVVGMQEFFYSQVPSTMKTIGFGLYLSVFGVGSVVSALLITAVELVTRVDGKNYSWFSDDMREARIDNYYWFLAFLSTLSFILFLNLSRYYEVKKVSDGLGQK